MNDEGLSLLKALQKAQQSSGLRHDSKALRARAAAWDREHRAQGMSCTQAFTKPEPGAEGTVQGDT